MELKNLIELSDAEKKTLLRLRADAEQARQHLSDAAFQAHQIEKLRASAAEACLVANKRIEDRIGEIAKDNGIDLTSHDAGRWNFNFDTMELRRLGPQLIQLPDPPKSDA